MTTDTGTDEYTDAAGGEHNRLKTLGKYRIERRIGAGGMGTVFLARDDALNRTVALKVLPKDRAENPVLVRRFKAEGQAAAHMEHPNIVRVFEAGEADGFLYMALEYVEGIDVHELVERRGVVPVKRSTDIIRQTALALEHAHQKGIVHRDIKPSNLLIKRDGSVKLADMGLARSVDETLETNITRAGTTVGTVDYMSPEQARNSKAADVRSDIYSLGCTWFHMLTGHPPFPEGGMTNKLQAHAVSARPDPRQDNDRVPEAIVAIIQRMMARKPDDRYQTPRELIDDLEATRKMHRNVDESALAALASEADDREWQVPERETDAEVRVEDVDDFDLAALRDSGEHEAEPPQAPPRKIRKRGTPARGKPSKSKRKTTAEAATTSANAETETVDEPAAPARRAFPPVKEDGDQPRQPAARRTPPPATEKPSRGKRPRTRPKATPSQQQRKVKRGSVTTAGGAAPQLPGKDPTGPVDASAGSGFDLESLKFIIPAILTVIALGAIGFALFNNADGIGVIDGVNPYDNGRPAGGADGPAEAAVPKPKRDPESAAVVAADPPESPDPPPQVVEADFPGAEDAQPANRLTPLIPDWVEAFRHPRRAAERTLTVRRRPDGPGQPATLTAALRSLPSEGGTIELDGDGPFALEAADLPSRERIRIAAVDGRNPVIQLRTSDDMPESALLHLERTRLELEGVHLVLAGQDAGGRDLIRVADGDVMIRNCSITVEQPGQQPLTALRILSRADSRGGRSGRCLLENVLVRGERLTAIALEGPVGDLVAGNCLLISGQAPAIMLGPSQRSPSDARRGIRLLATTIASARTGLLLRHSGDDQNLVPTDVVMRHSLLVGLSARSTAGESSMATLHGWPRRSSDLGAASVQKLTWRSEQTSFAGWSQLLTLANADGEPQEHIAGADEWRRFWNSGLRSGSVIAQSLELGSPVHATPESVHTELVAAIPSLGEGQPPGCRPDEFPTLPGGLIEHVLAATKQPLEPESLGGGMTIEGEPLRFDLGLRRSLARFLASDACVSGTHVIAFGSGLKELDPLVIENKSVRLEFESTGKTPLQIQAPAARDGAPREEAFITVHNGTLDLVGGWVKLPGSRSQSYPRSVVHVENGSLAIRDSKIEGPRLDLGDAFPLIRVAASDEATDRNILLENSFLVGRDSLVSGPAAWNTLVARNCVLVAGTDALVIEGPPPSASAAVVLDHCTVAANGVAIRADIDPSIADEGRKVTIYTRASVFAGHMDTGQTKSAVVAHPPGAAERGALVWWGSANGYSDRLAGSVIAGNIRAGNFHRDWTRNWGDGHEANPLTGKADVLFADSLPDLPVAEAKNFALAGSSTAATWGPGGTPLGADVEAVGPQARQSESDGGGGKTSDSPRPGRPRQNDPGF